MFGRRKERVAAFEASLEAQRQRTAEQLEALPERWLRTMAPGDPQVEKVFGVKGVEDACSIIQTTHSSSMSVEWAEQTSFAFHTAKNKYLWDNTYPPIAAVDPWLRRVLATSLVGFHVYKFGMRFGWSVAWDGNDVRPALTAIGNAWNLGQGELERAIAVSCAMGALTNGSTNLFFPPTKILFREPWENETGLEVCFGFRQIHTALNGDEAHLIVSLAKEALRRLAEPS